MVLISTLLAQWSNLAGLDHLVTVSWMVLVRVAFYTVGPLLLISGLFSTVGPMVLIGTRFRPSGAIGWIGRAKQADGARSAPKKNCTFSVSKIPLRVQAQGIALVHSAKVVTGKKTKKIQKRSSIWPAASFGAAGKNRHKSVRALICWIIHFFLTCGHHYSIAILFF